MGIIVGNDAHNQITVVFQQPVDCRLTAEIYWAGDVAVVTGRFHAASERRD